MIKLFLFDIEGTTTDINFVHKVLFPYSENYLKDFVQNHYHESAIATAIEKVRATVKEEENKEIDLLGVIQKLLSWIKEDRKHGALKEIQGHIWDIGYSKGDFQGHVYPDVKSFFMQILQKGSKIGIYSSGSVHAQKLIFGYSCDGDLTALISYYFDTKIGHKREAGSYRAICQAVNLAASEIHFFSDIPEELMAAEKAGMSVTQVLRPGTKFSNFEGISSFESFSLSL